MSLDVRVRDQAPRPSEAEAYLRIQVARIGRRLPIVLERLAAGRIQLSAIVRLAPHLTAASAEALLDRAEGRSKRQIEELAAELAPRPDAPARVRRLPSVPGRPDPLVPGRVAPPPAVPRPVEASAPPPKPPPAVVIPLAPARYKVQFTASSELEGKLARARAFLRHQIPDVDETPSSRHIPAAVQRAAWQRDGGRCTFADASGRRCLAVEGLEFHHEVPFALGDDHSLENVRLLCKEHNRYQAELDFGADFMRQRIAERRASTETSHPAVGGRAAEAGGSPA